MVFKNEEEFRSFIEAETSMYISTCQFFGDDFSIKDFIDFMANEHISAKDLVEITKRILGKRGVL